jgi:hypothetical protein
MFWLLPAMAIFSLGLFIIPAFVIRPFKYQSPGALSLAITLKRIAPSLTLITLVLMLVICTRLWQRSSWLARTGVVVLLAISAASAVMSRQNYFEWMFNPIANAVFVAPENARLDDKEMVMVVQIGSETRAYPILQMAYHHILNDTVAGVPIVVTY